MRTIRYTNDSGLAAHTKIIDTETGQELPNMVSKVAITVEPDGVVEASVTFGLVKIDTTAGARWFLDHVENGRLRHREVASITFADGKTVQF